MCEITLFWRAFDGEKMFEGQWYYTPEETTAGKLPGHDDRELFLTSHHDEHPVSTIDSQCSVLSWQAYQRWVVEDEEDDEATFVCRSQYHPGTGEFVPLNGASSLGEVARQAAIRSMGLGATPAGTGTGGGAGPSTGGGAGEKRALDSAAFASTVHGVHRRSKLSVFAEAAARLTPHAAPERLPCRERELEEVTSALRSAVLEGGLGASLYISGTPGTGKTATAAGADLLLLRWPESWQMTVGSA